MKTISGNISIVRYYKSSMWETGIDFLYYVKQCWSNIIVYDIDGNYEDFLPFKEMQKAERFLHGGGQTYDVTRVMIKELGCFLLSFVEECGVLAISYHESFENIKSDELICKRQLGSKCLVSFPDGSYRSFADVTDQICKLLKVSLDNLEESFLVEITHTDKKYNTVDELEKNESRELFAFLSGDEGYVFVPEELVKKRLSYKWGSREFIAVYAYEGAFVFLNLLDSCNRKEYLKRQEIFGNAIYGGVNDYFYMESCPLSVNHGIFFSIEFVMTIKTLISSVVDETENNNNKSRSFYKRIRETKNNRKRILEVLQKSDMVSIAEIGALGEVLLKSQNIAPLVEKVKYMLELLEGDLELLYSERNNLLVTILTVVGLFFAFLQVLLTLI